MSVIESFSNSVPKDLQSPRGQINFSAFKIQPQFLIPFPAKGKQAKN